MADQDLPISGKDTRLQFLVKGVPQAVTNQITSFTASRTVSEIMTKTIGSSTVFIDQEPEGWEGTFEVAAATVAIDDVMDAVDAAQRARLPNSLQLVDVTNYRNGTSNSWIYPDIKINYERTVRRTQATVIRITWKTGLARISL